MAICVVERVFKQSSRCGFSLKSTESCSLFRNRPEWLCENTTMLDAERPVSHLVYCQEINRTFKLDFSKMYTKNRKKTALLLPSRKKQVSQMTLYNV